MKIFTPLFISLLISIVSFAQENSSGFDVRVGLGGLVLDETPLQVYEAEVNYKMNPYIAFGSSANYAQHIETPEEDIRFVQLNGNAFVSPFKNNGKHDFRIGGGFNYAYHIDMPTGTEQSAHQLGYNVVIEHTTTKYEHFTLGGKVFMQNYGLANNRLGFVLKVGVKL